MANFMGKFRMANKIGNTSRIYLVWIESLTILDLYYAKNRKKQRLSNEK